MIAAKVALVVYLQPLGPVAERDLRAVETGLQLLGSVTVRRLSEVGLPADAFYPGRRRWRAEKLLSFLVRRLPLGDGARILGVTAKDISTRKGAYADWGILGLADLGGPAAVVSSFRCRRGSRGPAHARTRLGKIAAHEVGHTLGLDHCPIRSCLMEDAGGRVRTVDRERAFCPGCRRRIDESL